MPATREATRPLSEAMELLAEVRHLRSIQEIPRMTLEEIELVRFEGEYLIVGFGRSTRDTGPPCAWYFNPSDESWSKLD